MTAITDYVASQQQCGALVMDDPALVARQFVLLLMGELAFPALSGAVERTVLLFLRAHAAPAGGTG